MNIQLYHQQLINCIELASSVYKYSQGEHLLESAIDYGLNTIDY